VESYGDFLADRGYQPMLLEWADRVAEGEPIDTTAAVAAHLQASGFSVSWVKFEVATVVFGAEETPPSEGELTPFVFESVTVNNRGEVIATEAHQSFYFEEPLGDRVAPLKLVAIPSGEFIMGSPEHEPEHYSSESPQHQVKVSPFFISQYPVTQAQWRSVAALPRQERDLDPAPSDFKGEDRPVEQVSWHEAVEFCARLSAHTGRTYRLPTEAEWEYACRSVNSEQLSVTSASISDPAYPPFYFGETLTGELANYKASNTYAGEPEGKYRGETTPVGQFPPNAFGLYDLHGNVWEWCLDHWHDNYEGAPADGSAWLTEDDDVNRVLRGGSWFNIPSNCRSAYRHDDDPGSRFGAIGFRVVCEARGL
jgi:formylglycine-generating enzyme required for sulfatase activity